eukprot:jgi/Tetstr1/431355/TSEL_021046.t1
MAALPVLATTPQAHRRGGPPFTPGPQRAGGRRSRRPACGSQHGPRQRSSRLSAPPLHAQSADVRSGSDSGAPAVSGDAAAGGQPAEPLLYAVEMCECRTLPMVPSLQDAQDALRQALRDVAASPPAYASGVLRFEVPTPSNQTALRWLRGQFSPSRCIPGASAVYFSPRRSSAPDTAGSDAAEAQFAGDGAVAGIGAAAAWVGAPGEPLDERVVLDMARFLSASSPRIRVMGGARFDARQTPDADWAPFGSFYFTIPQLELSERPGCSLLAATVVWAGANAGAAAVPAGLPQACDAALALLAQLRPPARTCRPAPKIQVSGEALSPTREQWMDVLPRLKDRLEPADSGGGGAGGEQLDLDGYLDKFAEEFQEHGQEGLDALLDALEGKGMPAPSVDGSSEGADGGGHKPLSKVVLARRWKVDLEGRVDPLELLEALQDRDSRPYQLLLRMPNGDAFLGSTPERLFCRTGTAVASEAVAGSRARGTQGSPESDFWLALDLLRNPKDHMEFTIVRESIRQALQAACTEVGMIQHLYGRLSGRLRPGANDATLLAALHPTPAVCGHPQDASLGVVRETESFDRGFYAGPFGWMSGAAAEFSVAIRSALLQPQLEDSAPASASLSVYTGVGIVPGSDASQEWAELELKAKQFAKLLVSAPPLSARPNLNAAWAAAAVEELLRCGVRHFCVAPGSRSSPLTAAIAAHPRAQPMVCIDERSLAFFALGATRGSGTPAVLVCSSGTAVANMLPAVIEAAQTGVPLIVVSADRPAEMRDTGANQTIDQVKIFGGYTRWHADLPAPCSEIPIRTVVTAIDQAVRMAQGSNPGPVHLNFQFREPLAPAAVPWDPEAGLAGLARWEGAQTPFTLDVGVPAAAGGAEVVAETAELAALRALVAGAKKGLIVAGELTSEEDVAAAVALGQALRWPVVADVLSGLRVGGVGRAAPAWGALDAGLPGLLVLHHVDQLLAGGAGPGSALWDALRPDAVLQLGGHLTSKRLLGLLEWAALEGGASWVLAGPSPARHDPAYALSMVLRAPLPLLAKFLTTESKEGPVASTLRHNVALSRWRESLALLDAVADAEIGSVLATAQAEPGGPLPEPLVARAVAEALPRGHALFLGNSMPIRDMDMYANFPTSDGKRGSGSVGPHEVDVPGFGAPVAANRGASGIDGVLSTAAGFAEGVGRPTTLLLGDVSFVHDTNGLNLLREGEGRRPLTVVVVNNGGGGIFRFLPINGQVSAEDFTQLWETPTSGIDIGALCRAHGIPHQKVKAAGDLAGALAGSWSCNRHCVVEVVVGRPGAEALDQERQANVDFHGRIKVAVAAAAERAVGLMTGATAVEGDLGLPLPTLFKVVRLSLQPYDLPCRAQLTSGGPDDPDSWRRRGLLLRAELAIGGADAAVGVGDIAPLPGLHAETAAQAADQAAVLSRLLEGLELPLGGALRRGALTGLLSAALGPANAGALYPSVRFGLEAALLGALAAARGTSLAHLLAATAGAAVRLPGGADVAVNGLLGGAETPASAAHKAARLAELGYRSIKVKVGRREDPRVDAAVLLAVREAAAAGAGIEYVEEPCAAPSDIPMFFVSTGLRAGLDETVDEHAAALRQGAESPVFPQLLSFPAIAAVVIKPSVVGGIEATEALAAEAAAAGKAVVLSSAFESSVGLAVIASMAAAHEACAAATEPTSHGLATAGWLAQDVVAAPLTPTTQPPPGGRGWERAAISAAAAAEVLAAAGAGRPVDNDVGVGVGRAGAPRLAEYVREVGAGGGRYRFHVLDSALPLPADGAAHDSGSPTVVLLHGFLGCAEDWRPIMGALGSRVRCLAVDLPGHGCTSVTATGSAEELPGGAKALAKALADAATATAGPLPAALRPFELPAVAEAVGRLVEDLVPQGEGGSPVVLVGYSKGARVALMLAASRPTLPSASVLISGSPGLEGAAARAPRAARDAGLAAALLGGGLPAFLETWYRLPLFASLTRGWQLHQMLTRRRGGGQSEAGLAAALAAGSSGRQPPLWTELPAVAAAQQLTFIAGAKDKKFVALAHKMAQRAGGEEAGCKVSVVPETGHAVHLEAPLALIERLQGAVARVVEAEDARRRA